MNNRNLFILCSDAFVEFGGAAPRFNQIASGLLAHGWETTVVGARRSSPKGIAAEKDFPGKIIRTPFPAGCWPIMFDRKGLRFLYRKAMIALGRGHLFKDPRKGWADQITKHKYWDKLGQFPDAVMGVSFGGVSSLYAAKQAAERFGKPLFLEFQDPCAELDPVEQQCLNECIQCCAAIITTTSAYAARLKQQYPDAAAKIFPVHMAYETFTWIQPDTSRKGSVVFLHAGALYGRNGRSADAFLFGMKRAFENDPALMGKCCFRLLGGWLGAQGAKMLSRKLGIDHAVEVLDAVPYAQSIEAMNAADVLLVIKFSGSRHNMQIPGKLFQYFGRHKPILGIMGECEAADLIHESGLGKTFEHEDTEGIAGFIRKYTNNPELLRIDFRPNLPFIEQFSVKSMGDKLHGILSSASSSR